MKNIKYRRLFLRFLHDKAATIRTYLFLLLVILCCMIVLWDTVLDLMQSRLMRCYSQSGSSLLELDENEVSVGEAIFFHETSCQFDSNNDIALNGRQACAVESAALHHPSNEIYLLVAAPVLTSLNSTTNRAVKAILQYPNVKIRHININKYVENTPLAEVVHGALRRSSYPVSHTSDVLRYTTLLKFRGTYMDLDVIVLKNILDVTNFVGAESPRSLGAGIINFGPDALGQEMSAECALELQRTFDGSEWGNNGPGVITRVLYRKCNTTSVNGMLTAGPTCRGFHVLPVSTFYAFPFWEAKMFFKSGKLLHAQKVLNTSSVIHFWNKVTAQYRIPKISEGVPYSYYARRHCPKVYEFVNGNF